MALLNGADSVSASALPVGMDWYAGYAGGRFPSYSAIVERFPKALHLSIAVNAEEDADVLDCENGDAVPSQCAAWVRRQHARGKKVPGVYTFESQMNEVKAALNAAGLKRNEYFLWLAWWNGDKILQESCEAHQWGDPAFTGGQWDGNVSDPSIFGPVAVPADNTNMIKAHYDWFDGRPRKFFGKRRVERKAVQLYDKLRATQTPTKHPHRVQLAFVRKVCKWYAGRVYKVAHDQSVVKNGQVVPSWGVEHRGWRYQQLAHRAQGQRIV